MDDSATVVSNRGPEHAEVFLPGHGEQDLYAVFVCSALQEFNRAADSWPVEPLVAIDEVTDVRPKMFERDLVLVASKV
jgi:hypothetical protein